MTRAQFLNDMYRRLCGNGLDKDQAEQHLTYYAEMLADRMEEGMTEDQAVSSMEDVDTIARRILEEEGLPYRPPEAIVQPPVYPDASKLGGGGGKRSYQVPKKWNGQKAAQIALWTLAIVIALGAASRWLWGRNVGHNRSYSTTVVDNTSTPIAELAPFTEAYYSGEYAWEAAYDYGYEYSGGMNSYAGASLRKLDIEWAAGTVFVQSWNGDEIQIREYSHSELSGRDEMIVEDKGDELTIRYREGSSLGNVKGDKWLTVMVPDRMLEELEIETTSADVQLNGLEQGELDVSSASGYIFLTECYVQKAELETISGDLNLSGVYADELDISTASGDVFGDAHCVDVDIETISGDISLTTWENTERIGLSTTIGDVWCSVSNAAIRSIDADTTSGEVYLSIPWEMGFILEHSTVSGGISSSFDMDWQNGKYVCNGGGCEIEVETISGNLEIY